MAVSSEDISVVLSGGTTNINPNLSLGGEPSSSPVVDGSLNNLFGDISADQSEEGTEDYRCIYIFNDGDAEVFDLEIYISENFEGGATVEIGARLQNETQRITISNGPVTGGNMLLSYAGYNFTSQYNSDLGVWAGKMQESLRNLTDSTGDLLLEDVEVIAQYSGSGSSTIIFDILFVGNNGYTNHPVLTLVSNNLTPSIASISVATNFEGFPINTVASEIEVDTTPPGNISFSAASQASPISLPRLKPTEGFPLWVKRVITADTPPQARDGFKLRFSAKTL